MRWPCKLISCEDPFPIGLAGSPLLATWNTGLGDQMSMSGALQSELPEDFKPANQRRQASSWGSMVCYSIVVRYSMVN